MTVNTVMRTNMKTRVYHLDAMNIDDTEDGVEADGGTSHRWRDEETDGVHSYELMQRAGLIPADGIAKHLRCENRPSGGESNRIDYRSRIRRLLDFQLSWAKEFTVAFTHMVAACRYCRNVCFCRGWMISPQEGG